MYVALSTSEVWCYDIFSFSRDIIENKIFSLMIRL